MARFVEFKMRLDTVTIDMIPAQINVAAIEGMVVVRPNIIILATDGVDWSTWQLGLIFRKTDGIFTEIGSFGAGTTTSQNASPGAQDWNVTFVVTNGDMQIDTTGEAGKTIDWTAWVTGWVFEP